MPVERFVAPNLGQAFRTAPAAVSKQQAYAVENALTHYPGKLVVRGPFRDADTIYSAAELAANPAKSRLWVHETAFLIHNNAAAGDGKYFKMGGGGVFSLSTVVTSRQLDTRSAHVGDYAYGFERNVGISSEYVRLMRWDGTTTAPTFIAGGGTTGPQKGVDVVAHLGRLFVAGGVVPGTGAAAALPGGAVPVFPNGIFWSDIGGPTTSTLADWQDDATGLVNQIQVGSKADAIVGLASLKNQLVILKQDSVYVLYGDTPSSFVLRRIANNIGCLASNTILTTDNYVAWIDESGPMIYDGTTIENLGGPDTSCRDGAPWYYATVVSLPNDYLLFCCPALAAGGSPARQFWLLHMPSRAWSRVTASTAIIETTTSDTLPVLFANELGYAMIFDGRNVRALEPMTADSTVLRTGREKRSYTATYEIIAMQIRTRLASLGHPLRKAKLRYLVLDHLLTGNGADRWSLTLQDALTNAIVSQIDYASTFGSATLRTRDSSILNAEANELMVNVVLNGSATADLTAAEFHDLYVEYEPAQRK